MMSTLLRMEKFLGTLGGSETINITISVDYSNFRDVEELSGCRDVSSTYTISATLAYQLDTADRSCEIISLRFQNNKSIPLISSMPDDSKKAWFTLISTGHVRVKLEYVSSDSFRISPSGGFINAVTFDPT